MVSATPNSQFSKDDTWDSLKRAIASSSGFQRWRLERATGQSDQNTDQLVQRYLRETLETLAY